MKSQALEKWTEMQIIVMNIRLCFLRQCDVFEHNKSQNVLFGLYKAAVKFWLENEVLVYN